MNNGIEGGNRRDAKPYQSASNPVLVRLQVQDYWRDEASLLNPANSLSTKRLSEKFLFYMSVMWVRALNASLNQYTQVEVVVTLYQVKTSGKLMI